MRIDLGEEGMQWREAGGGGMGEEGWGGGGGVERDLGKKRIEKCC
jgi:hypothetical protein